MFQNKCLKQNFALFTSLLIAALSPIIAPDAVARSGQEPPAKPLREQLNRIIVRPGRGAVMAIPRFITNDDGAASLAEELRGIIDADLDFARVVNILGQSLYPKTKISDPLHIDFSAWRRPPVQPDYLLVGTTMTNAEHVLVEVFLYDVQAGGRLFSRQYRGTRRTLRSLAHHIADDVVMLLTGTKGIASSKIAFVSRRTGHPEIYIMDYDGWGVRRFTYDRSMAFFPAWSPDGKRIAYVSFKEDRPFIQIRSVIDRLPVRAFRFSSGTPSSPVFSPDGRYLAFSSSKDSNSMQLYIADLQTGRIRQLTRLRSVIHTSPRWNPRTGRELAFISDRSGTPQIYVIDTESGTTRRLLTEGGAADSPAWSPDGRYIAFAWRPPEATKYDIFIMDIASQQIVQLTDGPGSNESPTWSPDGRHLAFQSNRSGRFEIYVMHVDGSGVKQITKAGGTSPAWWRAGTAK